MPTTNEKASVAVIGAGYWGINLVRNFHATGRLKVVCDSSTDSLKKVSDKFPGLPLETDYQKILARSDISGVVIAAPAAMHYDLTRQALEAGKDVFVEKPLALKFHEAYQLQRLAQSHERILMVGHILQYHPGLLKLKELITSGELGTLEYIYSNRLNLGKIRREENILWSFAPHDISIMLWLTGSIPIQVNAVGGSYLTPNVFDTTISTLSFDNGVRGHVFVSWLHPFKEQRLVVVGSKRMATFVDSAPKGEKLLMYEKKISDVNGALVAEKPKGVPVTFDEETEPLRAECDHFLHCMETREKPRTDGEEGLKVLKVLQSCQRSLQMNGQPV
ncbi:MAG: Gfo/Idh/MocA family oxidoreductase, partial [Pseudomonadota bacterium]